MAEPSSAQLRGWPEGWSVPAVPPLPQEPPPDQPHRPNPYRGWPANQTASAGLTRFDAMCGAIDAATTLQALAVIRDEAAQWEAAAKGRNAQAEREASAARQRAARKAEQIARWS
jgi:hypothetical protein